MLLWCRGVPRRAVITPRPEEAAAVRKSRSAPQRSKAAGRPRGSERRLSFDEWVFGAGGKRVGGGIGAGAGGKRVGGRVPLCVGPVGPLWSSGPLLGGGRCPVSSLSPAMGRPQPPSPYVWPLGLYPPPVPNVQFPPSDHWSPFPALPSVPLLSVQPWFPL